MQQETSYPDPSQLRAFAREPMPFHEVTPSEVEVTEDGFLYHDGGNVVYRYRGEYINVETEPDGWHRVTDLWYAEMTHSEAWDSAEDVEVGEDFVVATGMAPTPEDYFGMYEAYWTLDSITIKSNNQ